MAAIDRSRHGFCLIVSVTAALGLGLLGAGSATAQAVPDRACPGPADEFRSDGNLGSRMAQTFVALNSGSLVRAEINVISSPGTVWSVELLTVDSSRVPSNTPVLASTTTTSSASGVTTIVAVFAQPATVTAGQRYALSIGINGGGVNSGVRTNEDCAISGSLWLRQAPGTTWQEFGVGNDMVFATFVEPPPQPDPQPDPQPEPQPEPLPTSKADGTLTLDANKGKVERGNEIELSGQIDTPSDEGCEAGRTIELQRHKKGDPDSAFHTFTTVPADAAGSFHLRKPVGVTKVYRAVVHETARCDDETSNTVTVRVQKKKAAQEA